MLIGTRNHTVSDRRRHRIKYLLDGTNYIVTATVTSPSATLTVDSVAVVEPRKIVFFTNGGLLNEEVTLAVQVTLSNGEILNDTLDFVVVAA